MTTVIDHLDITGSSDDFFQLLLSCKTSYNVLTIGMKNMLEVRLSRLTLKADAGRVVVVDWTRVQRRESGRCATQKQCGAG